ALGGYGGPFRGPLGTNPGDRGAARVSRDAPSVGGYGGPFRGPPLHQSSGASFARTTSSVRAPTCLARILPSRATKDVSGPPYANNARTGIAASGRSQRTGRVRPASGARGPARARCRA